LAKIFRSMEFSKQLFIRFFKLWVGNDTTVDTLVLDVGEEVKDNLRNGN
jgi:hypothetical protein